MKKRLAVGSSIAILLMALFSLTALATPAELFFSVDRGGEIRVTTVQEGDQIWIVVYDPDQDIDTDLRDKMHYPDVTIQLFDPNTGARIAWGDGDYLEETDANTGLFVSNRPFRIGTRAGFFRPQDGTHILPPEDFMGGNYMYVGGVRREIGVVVVPPPPNDDLPPMPFGALTVPPPPPPIDPPVVPPVVPVVVGQGRFENNNTLVGLYQDPNDPTDVALAMMKIIDHAATISWDREIFNDPRGAATITVIDKDENLNSDRVEFVPVFIIINPGSWNPVQPNSAANFSMLKRLGGVVDDAGTVANRPIRWYNIYDSGLTTADVPLAGSSQLNVDGSFYIEYPTAGEGNVTYFDTDSISGVTRVMFFARETGMDTGVFRLHLNEIRKDLGFNILRVRDVLVAYYLDPNDFDDFALATAYIGTNAHVSATTFTGPGRAQQDIFWLGRDPVHVQVIDADANTDACCPEQVVVHIVNLEGEGDSEWIILDEIGANSPVFFAVAGKELLPAWNALGSGIDPATGGFQLRLDNWRLEAFNEDTIFARYNDQWYAPEAMAGLGDRNLDTAFPPTISRIRLANDVSFDLMEIASTEVFDGVNVQMYFLDWRGARLDEFVHTDAVFIKVIDLDQNEDVRRRERISSTWDGRQNLPFGPADVAAGDSHPVNDLLGTDNIFEPTPTITEIGQAKVYVLNPRNGLWAAVDLLETGINTGIFVSVICVTLISPHPGVPTLDVKPGDTILAVYQDPSNHSDSAWISIKVALGGAVIPPVELSTTTFVDAAGVPVTTYTDADDIFVRVADLTHAGAVAILGAVEIEGMTFDLLPLVGAPVGTFITAAISMAELGVGEGDTITATYTDPLDPADISTDTISIIADELTVVRFFAGPNPFAHTTHFTFEGTGIATEFTVAVYDLSGRMVWTRTLHNVTGITWDGRDEDGQLLANAPYRFVIMATDGVNNFTGQGTVFINR